MPRRATWQAGWWSKASHRPSPNFGARPAGLDITLAVVHCISLPPGLYKGDGVERLFLNRLDWNAHPYYDSIRGLEVSAHFFIRRGGRVLQFVSCDQRAWHAGRSTWQGKDNCNDYSVGIELEGSEGGPFQALQYGALCRLLGSLARRYPLQQVVGHEHVAPVRKSDPGPGFDWLRLSRGLACSRPHVPLLTFARP